MTNLRLFETDSASIAEETTPHLFETPRSQRYRRSRWPYDVSVVLHAMALVSVVILARHLTRPPSPPTPTVAIENSTRVFFLPKFGIENSHRRPRKTQHSKPAPVAVLADIAAAPAPAPGKSVVVDTGPIADEKPQKSAFDPPLPTSEARLQGRRGDPTEAGLGSATVNVRGSPTAEVRPGGLGEGSSRGVSNGGSMFSVRPGFDDGAAGGGATPPRILGPLPIPDYPADARTRRLQGVVVLEVTLEAFGKARVRGVLSQPLGFGIEDAARNAAERLKFTPARQGGRPVDAIVQVRVTFTLTDGAATAVMGGA